MPRTETLFVRLTKEEKAALEAAASSCGLSTSAFVRLLAKKYSPKWQEGDPSALNAATRRLHSEIDTEEAK